MRDLFGWTWSWGIGWHRGLRVHPVAHFVDSAFKVFASLLFAYAAVSQTVALIGLLVYGVEQVPGAVAWAYASDNETLAWIGVIVVPAVTFFFAAATWWSPRNPDVLRDWLRRRRAKRARLARTRRPGQKASKPRGRPPRAGTVALRRRLEADQARGQLATTREYVEWLLATDPAIKENVAYGIVRRELQRRK